jgi:hypothetical protein
MGRDDTSRPGPRPGFDQQGRSLTPISARKIVTSGASEIVVDDFVDTYLRERPKTIPEISLHAPPEPEEPPVRPTPKDGVRPSRATRRGLGGAPAPLPPRPGGFAPAERPRGFAPAPRTADAGETLPSTGVDAKTARHLLAVGVARQPAPSAPTPERAPGSGPDETLPSSGAEVQAARRLLGVPVKEPSAGETLPSGGVDAETARRLLAARDERISQLEEEIKLLKDAARASQPDNARASSSDARASQPSASVIEEEEPRTMLRPSGDAGSPVASPFRPAAPPRQASAPVIKPFVKTVPMAAVPSPQPSGSPRAEATMLMPAVEPPASPAQATSALVSSPAPSGASAAISAPLPAAPASSLAAPAGSSSSSAPPGGAASAPSSSSPLPSAGELGTPTMVLDRVGEAPISGLSGLEAAPSAPPPGSSGLTPAPFTAPQASVVDAPIDGSPAVAPSERKRRGGVAAAVLALTLVLGAGGAFAFLRGLGPFGPRGADGSHAPGVTARSTGADARPSSTAAPSHAATATPTSGSSPSVAASGAGAVSSAAAPSGATSAPSEAPSAAPSTPAPSAKEATAEELKALLSFQSFLTVESAGDAMVVVQGQEVGRTNQRVVVRCGPKNVRLRGPDGRWVSEGVAVQITCMQHVIVPIAVTSP